MEALSSVYRQIPIADIQPSPHQARKDFDPETLKGLAESIKQEGLLEPIIVRLLKQNYFELVSGERRLRAAKLLGWEAIEAKVIETTSDAEAAAKGLVENLQRQDLNPIEEAEGFQTLNQLDPREWNQTKVALISGRTQSYISQSFGILKLAEPVKENIRRLILSRSHGLEIMRLPLEQQVEAGKKVADLSLKDTRQLVDRLLGKSTKARKARPPVDTGDPMAEIWVKIKDSATEYAAWQVGYSERETWTFQVKPGGGDYAGFLTSWFEAMAKAIQAHDPLLEGDKEVVPPYHPTTLPPTTEPGTTKAEEKRDSSAVRIPTNQAEEQELEAAARQGPTAFYIWVYGKDSPYVQDVQGKTWEEVIGLSDPKEAMDTFLQGYKMMTAG